MSKGKDEIINAIIKVSGLDPKNIRGMLLVATDGEDTTYSMTGSIAGIVEALVVASGHDMETKNQSDIDLVIQLYNSYKEYKEKGKIAGFTTGEIGEA